MEEQPKFEQQKESKEEEALELKKENALPYLQEEKIALPKDYDATIGRLKSQLEQSEDTSLEGKALFAAGVAITTILMFTYFNSLLGFPRWLDWVHHILVFGEASIPFALSFFLKKNNHATILRLIGIIVLLVYLFTLFF